MLKATLSLCVIVLLCISICLFIEVECADPEKSAFKFRRRHLTFDPYQEEAVRNLTNLLFPHQDKDPEHRALQVVKPPYDPAYPVPCVICRGLTVCTALNGFLVQEKYYPKNLNFRETCKVIDTFGSRIEKSIFGGSRTFRDTAQCREMVMQYLCLFYGTDNDMYTNYCVFQERTDPVNQVKTLAQRPPCRSFCVQLSMYCANDPDFFLQTCLRIKCPPTETQCTPDPILRGLPLDSNLGCDQPYYDSPYFRASANSRYGYGQLMGGWMGAALWTVMISMMMIYMVL